MSATAPPRCRGQSTLELTVLFTAVASALILMAGYVQGAFNAGGNALEEQLNGAVADNTPGPPRGGGGGEPPPDHCAYEPWAIDC